MDGRTGASAGWALLWAGALVAAVGALGASRSAVAAEPAGDTFTVFPRDGTTRFPDAAFDPENGVFLVVSGQLTITGAFVARDGALLSGPFTIAPSPTALSPRVAYHPGAGAFLVTWIDEVSPSDQDIGARLVRYTGTGPDLVGEPIEVDDGESAKYLEAAPSSACSAVTGECLVTWGEWTGFVDVQARLVDASARPFGPELDIGSGPTFDSFPAVTWNSLQDEYFVVYVTEPQEGTQVVAGRRVSAATGEPVSDRLDLYSNDGLNHYPEVAYDSNSNQYLAVTWWGGEGGGDVYGARVDGEGQRIGDVIPAAATPIFEGGDGIGLGFSAEADAWLAVFQGPDESDGTHEVYGVEVRSDGVPGEVFMVTRTLAPLGVYQPRAVADPDSPRWLVVTVVDYARVDGQFVDSEVAGDDDTGGDDDSAPADDDASDDDAVGGDDDEDVRQAEEDWAPEGCACATGPPPKHGPPVLVAGLLGAAWARRRPRPEPHECKSVGA